MKGWLDERVVRWVGGCLDGGWLNEWVVEWVVRWMGGWGWVIG